MSMAETVAIETLRLEAVRKSYDIGTPVEAEVLHGIDLALKQGEFTALIGPSGSGKTTLLNLIGLLDRPTGGELFIEGQKTSALNDTGRTRLRGRSIGFVFQYHYLLPAFTALENVMMPILAARRYPDEEMRDTAAALLDKVGLTGREKHTPAQLSGGQQQRVAIARALITDPPVILADEPTGNLDSRTSEEVLAIFQELNEAGKTIILITHENDIAMHAKRRVVFRDGRIVVDEPIAQVRIRSGAGVPA